ncbi:hypothetical protein JW992_09765 [candidate division KSB1 bacterium]|nr:hypothetical protein [candidate division KSB1 bacterium]
MAKVYYVKPKGSIVYKVLIALLAVALVATIVYPKKLWQKEEVNTKACRENMVHILYAELVYLNENPSYNDTLQNVVDFILSDTTGRRLRLFANLDSTLAFNIMDKMKGDSLAVSIIDTLKRYAHKMNIDTTAALILDSLRVYPNYSRFVDSLAAEALQEFSLCPTVNKPYIISVVDTSVIKELYISCPIDSLDSVAVASSFKLNKLGGLRISNHGEIKNGERSWKK